MFWLFNDDKPWFRAKYYGYGAGLPISWRGWVFLAFHVALILGLALSFKGRPQILIPAILLAAFLPMPIYAAKTRGGWRWRWGSED